MEFIKCIVNARVLLASIVILFSAIPSEASCVLVGKVTVPAVKMPGAPIKAGMGKRWPDGVIPFTFDTSATSDVEAVVQAVAAEVNGLNVGFTLIPYSGQKNYLVVSAKNLTGAFGGESSIGMMGGKQQLVLPSNASIGRLRVIARHELGHAMGLAHEHQCSDRDEYLSVTWNNVASQYQSDAKLSLSRTSGELVKPVGPFDFQSIMIYAQDAFAKPNTLTMQPLDPTVLWQTSHDYTPGDIEGLVELGRGN